MAGLGNECLGAIQILDENSEKIVGDSSVDACFSYDDSYIEKNGKPISISLPLEEKAFDEKRTRYFFEGLLPEGFTRKCLK